LITFIDIEYDEKTKKIYDFGALKEEKKEYHSNNFKDFLDFIKSSDYICGHNIIAHDVKRINEANGSTIIEEKQCIDTLLLSVLLFPNKPYHHLIKDNKIKPEDSNDPLLDSKNASALFVDEVYKFNQLSDTQQNVFLGLLRDVPGYSGFFSYLNFDYTNLNLENLIRHEYDGYICENAKLDELIVNYPLELALTLALSKTSEVESLFPKWVLHTFPMVEYVMLTLRGTPCHKKCAFCSSNLNPLMKANNLFGFDHFREFDGLPLQELAINAALENKSLIAVFPTGGGKSFTYQLPALMRGDNTRSLTVVISPLQSLMKDQVDNLLRKSITKAVALYGMLDPVERAKNIERVRNGEVSILYLAPESLRSKTIERLLLSRDIARFVIDEAHCFSTWGQDFRVDYLYIGDFIQNLQEKKQNNKKIPVSCFTATAKKDVIKDIEEYFLDKLDLKMEKITTSSTRKNLTFKVKNVEDEIEKYRELRLLLDKNDVPTIIYASRTKKVDQIYTKLLEDQYNVSRFHGKMETDEKIIEQNRFMNGDTRIMVATSAFGMGVDKDDIGQVIHFEISSSLENYVQEAGRAGRQKELQAECYVLYNETDLDKHFDLLNNTKLNIKEIQQIFAGIKKNVKVNKTTTKSALEIAKDAGWEENVRGLETRVRTAIAALEDAGYLERGLNSPRVFADGILSKNQAEASAKIDKSALFDDKEKVTAKRITKNLISNKYNKRSSSEESEARVDYLADVLGLPINIVTDIIHKLREEKILADSKDLACYLKGQAKQSSKIVNEASKLERFILNILSTDAKVFNLKEINEMAQEDGIKSNIKMIHDIINYLSINKVISLDKMGNYKMKISLTVELSESLSILEHRIDITESVLEYLYQLRSEMPEEDRFEDPILLSVLEIKDNYNKNAGLLSKEASLKDIEETLYYMKMIDSLKIEGGFLVFYSPMNIKRLDNGNVYKKSDYEKLSNFYTSKVEQIHIVGEYANKMVENYKEALQFVNDYFNIEYQDFLSKYFKGNRKKEISKKVSPAKFKQLFGELSADQLKIINDSESDKIVVAAGPGSGKTRLLVHKLAAISLMEDTRPDQMLMLTFSRAAVTEFKTRLMELIGNRAHAIEIKTFHSFSFDILGAVGSIEKSSNIIKLAIEQIENGEVDIARITKAILVIDEAQDMIEEEHRLVQILMEKNENLRVIAVGDDDQNIYEFRNSSNKYLKEFAKEAKMYELPQNYRSKKNLVDFSNRFVTSISGRMKRTPILPVQDDNGNIVVVQHTKENLYEPIVKHLLQLNYEGSTCILTRTNEQASIIAGMLNSDNNRAVLIQDNANMNLFNLYDLRNFYDKLTHNQSLSMIGNEQWKALKKEFLLSHQSSSNYAIYKNVLDIFEKFNSKQKYLSDFKEFLKQSSIDDFMPTNSLMVSTLHKAKGREFDNVYILFDSEYISNNKTKRLLYVGMTRAKRNLIIHTNSDAFQFNQIDNFKYHLVDKEYGLPERLVFTLTHRKVVLGYFAYTKNIIKEIEIGTQLVLFDRNRLVYKHHKVLKLSNSQVAYMDELQSSGYVFESAQVKHKLYWYDQEKEEEVLIILPEITYVKTVKKAD
jgi:ATP-dependent DNA helicase RecQ